MIRRYILHIEAHRGYRPRLSLRRAPFHGKREMNGGEPGHLIACRECSGGGYLHVSDYGQPPPAIPAE